MSKKHKNEAAAYGLALLKTAHATATKSLHQAIEDLASRLSDERVALANARLELAEARVENAELSIKFGDAMTANAAAMSKATHATLTEESRPAPTAAVAPVEVQAGAASEELSAELLEAARVLGWNPAALLQPSNHA